MADLTPDEWAYKSLLDGLKEKIALNLEKIEGYKWMIENVPPGKTAAFYKTVFMSSPSER
ncbi:hypothetical protein SAMN02745166_03096 [Prosthecobacter debontii]|uniref:Uncharacterized protein n=1 Tax=Prosthecobacter debontii TaxID=48467 RepID=A0A1T4YEG0_9BACT|nr:hypothetical protein SAMN02745166_03096 [Prosthecobacter debontii]